MTPKYFKRIKKQGQKQRPQKRRYTEGLGIYKLIYYIWHHKTYIRLEGKKYVKALARRSQPLSSSRLLSSNSKIFALIRGFPNSSHTEESCPAIRLRLIRVTGVTGVTPSESLYPLHDFILILVGQGIYQPHFQIWLFQILSQGPIIASVQNQIWNWLQSSEQMFLRLSVETILSFPMFLKTSNKIRVKRPRIKATDVPKTTPPASMARLGRTVSPRFVGPTKLGKGKSQATKIHLEKWPRFLSVAVFPDFWEDLHEICRWHLTVFSEGQGQRSDLVTDLAGVLWFCIKLWRILSLNTIHNDFLPMHQSTWLRGPGPRN